MSSNTPNLQLYKKDPVANKTDTFNITTMLNENWDKIDTAVGDKINKTQIKNTLTETTSGNVLDATQGKNLNDRLVSLENLTETTETLTINSLGSFTAAVKNGQLNVLTTNGNTVFQSVKNGNFVSGLTAEWAYPLATASVSNKEAIFTVTASKGRLQQNIGGTTNDKWYYCASIKSDSNLVGLGHTISLLFAHSGNGNYERISGITTQTDGNGLQYISIIDTRTSGWTEVRVKEVYAINLTAHGLASLTKAQCDAMFPYWLKYGIVSTLSGRLTCTKNLFDIKKPIIGSAVKSANNTITVTGSIAFKSDYLDLKLPANTQLTISANVAGNAMTNSQISVRDGNSVSTILAGSTVGLSYPKVTFNVPSHGNVRVYLYSNTTANAVFSEAIFSNIQIEYGSAATAYEAFNDNRAYTQDLQTKWDSFNVLTGVKTQGGNTKSPTQLTWTKLGTETTNYYLFQTSSMTDMNRVASDNITYIEIYNYNAKLKTTNWTNYAALDDYSFYVDTNNNLSIKIPKADLTGTTNTDVQNWLTAKFVSISYQLAVPNYTYHPIGNLKAGALSTFQWEAYIKDEGYYSSKANIVAGVAKAIDWVNKIDVTNQVFTPVDITKVTLASDGLSFTITGAVTGDWYEYGAFPLDGNSTNPDVTAKASTSIGSSVDANTDAAILLTKEVNSLRSENSLMKIYADNHAKDYTLQVPYGGVTTGTANTYAISTPTITVLTAGMAISLKFNVDSTGASTLNWCGLGAKGIKKANGSDATNIKAVGLYTLRFDGSAFILQGEGGEYGTATADKVLTGYSIGTDGGLINGIMANNGAVTITPSNVDQTITQGYHNGTGKVIAVTFDATKLLTGTTVANTPGTMPNNGAQNATLDTTTISKTIPAGYTTGGTVSHVLEEKTISPSNATQVVTPTSGKVLSKVTVNAEPNAVASNIRLGKIINGVTGSFGISVVAGDIAIYDNTSAGAISGYDYVKQRSVSVQVKGTIRVKHTLRGNNTGANIYSKIYVNDVPVGAEHHTTVGQVTTTYTDDITVDFGDIISLYAYDYVQNAFTISDFAICCSVSASNLLCPSV